MFRWCKLSLFLSLLMLGACSGTTLLYNRLDFLVPWYVDDYAELNGEQETYLEELLTPFLAWHRAQELPSYVKILGDIEASLDEPETQAGVEAIFAEFERAWLRLEGEALDSLLDLGAQLSDTQLDGFLEVLWEQQDEYKEEYLERPDDEFYEDSYDNLKDNAKEYLGALSDKQRDILRESSSKLLRSDEEWLRERADWFKQLEVILKRGPQWQQRVRAAVAARRDKFSPEYVRIYENNSAVIADAIALLLNSRTERQDRHVRLKLSDLREDLETLIAEGKAAGTPAG
ncbi:MAG: DUF6279 family lipoprotein [Halioglobus sp.]|nr:DUF6279 family lipoprotein [Halioglobus sp.]